MEVNIKNNIWLTYKCRMGAEDRLKFYDKWLNWAVSYYAVLLIGLNIFSEKHSLFEGIAFELNLFLSVVILVLSVWVQNSKLGEVAAKYRECYLALQCLYRLDDDETDAKLTEKYDDILKAYPNHEEKDYEAFIVKSVASGQSLIDPLGKEIIPKKWMHIKVWSRYLFKYCFVIFLYISPLIALWKLS